MKKRFFAAITVLLIMCVIIPINYAEAGLKWVVPEGYNEHDYCKVVMFLEQTDTAGTKNGEKLSDTYEPDNPDSFGDFYYWDSETDELVAVPRFSWTYVEGELCLYAINIANCGLVGSADFSECCNLWIMYLGGNNLSMANVRDCTSLDTIDLSENLQLSEIDATGCSSLNYISFSMTSVSSMKGIPNTIGSLDCSFSNITELDLASFDVLYNLSAVGNPNLTIVDLSNCSSLRSVYMFECNLSELRLPDYKQSLISLHIDSNQLTELDLNYPNLVDLHCGNNKFENLDLSNLPSLRNLECQNGGLTYIDLTGCTNLEQINCQNNPITQLDLSDCPLIPIEEVYTSGTGTISMVYQLLPPSLPNPIHAFVYAQADAESEFIGWYNEAGDLISIDAEFDFSGITGLETILIARFAPIASLPGDVDANGSVEAADAILALRHAMGLIELTPEQLAAADMDGSGEVRIDDAIIILRTAMGLLD